MSEVAVFLNNEEDDIMLMSSSEMSEYSARNTEERCDEISEILSGNRDRYSPITSEDAEVKDESKCFSSSDSTMSSDTKEEDRYLSVSSTVTERKSKVNLDQDSQKAGVPDDGKPHNDNQVKLTGSSEVFKLKPSGVSESSSNEKGNETREEKPSSSSESHKSWNVQLTVEQDGSVSMSHSHESKDLELNVDEDGSVSASGSHKSKKLIADGGSDNGRASPFSEKQANKTDNQANSSSHSTVQERMKDKEDHPVLRSSTAASSIASTSFSRGDSYLSSYTEDSQSFVSDAHEDDLTISSEDSRGTNCTPIKYDFLSSSSSSGDFDDSTRDSTISSTEEESHQFAVVSMTTMETNGASLIELGNSSDTYGSSALETPSEELDNILRNDSSVMETLSAELEDILHLSYFAGCLSKACGLPEETFSRDPRDREDRTSKPSLLVESNGKHYPADVYEHENKRGIMEKVACYKQNGPIKLDAVANSIPSVRCSAPRAPLSPKKGAVTTNSVFKPVHKLDHTEKSSGRKRRGSKERAGATEATEIEDANVRNSDRGRKEGKKGEDEYVGVDNVSTPRAPGSIRGMESFGTGVGTVRAGSSQLKALARAREKMESAVMARQKRSPNSPSFAKTKETMRLARNYSVPRSPWSTIEEHSESDFKTKHKGRSRKAKAEGAHKKKGDRLPKRRNHQTSNTRRSKESKGVGATSKD